MRKCRRLYSLISNKFVASLAVSDLLVGLTIPYHTAFYLNDSLCKNKALCLSRFVLIVLGCCASICNLISIALDRYIAILYPFHYCRLMTQRAGHAVFLYSFRAGEMSVQGSQLTQFS
uniref:G-protein coupled receptors family 1 profile domain-containing protein n=1 Tax=Timema shepardi TaxID=629360 RepID=A0A7R9AMM1_TIMSH|nr:unnamed protein product [Timema shepardi]